MNDVDLLVDHILDELVISPNRAVKKWKNGQQCTYTEYCQKTPI